MEKLTFISLLQEVVVVGVRETGWRGETGQSRYVKTTIHKKFHKEEGSNLLSGLNCG